MNKRNILSLAANLLSDYSNIQSYNISNDWKWPVSWTEDERKEFYRSYVCWLSRGDEERIRTYELEQPFKPDYGPSDFTVTSFIADLLQEAAYSQK